MQLKKLHHKLSWDRIPCTRCGSEDHATWRHGKNPAEIFTQLESRRINPQDSMYDAERFGTRISNGQNERQKQQTERQKEVSTLCQTHPLTSLDVINSQRD